MTAQPRSPQGHFLLGNLSDFTRDTLAFLLDVRQYGDLVKWKFGPFPAYIVNSPALMHQMLVADAEHYDKDRTSRVILNPVLGEGVFTSNGDFWKKQRKLVAPSFHTKRIGAYGEVMVDYANRLVAKWEDGDTLIIDHEMTALTMEVISKTLFDAQVGAETEEISEQITILLEVLNHRFNSLFPTPLWVPTPENRAFKRAIAKLDEIVARFVAQWRAAGVDKGDLLSMLLQARDDDGNPMSDKQVRDEAVTLFGAGHETTSNALTWVWYLLSQNPDAEARLHDELARVLGGRNPRMEDLPNLPYTEMVVKEAMRLYPPAFAVVREANTDVELGGYTLPKGSIIMGNIYGIQRDERYFPNPDRFDPDRFSADNEKQIPKYAYLPFGGGPRVCLGNAFAMMEARLVLATIAQKYSLALAPGHPVIPQRVFTLRAKHGVKMVAHQREAIPVLA
ncbi:MAG: cytochrome P450 [Chloroflexi bacterium]|uniref:cytochrome P450 n=1 Tax=Candidatus Flexifilum breve TaxID=3140694 RepID=UPI003136A629|nr:cytochrome P450 [Chloroflexota bacterium]